MEVWSVWFLMGAALVFFMQAGFAMVETGFTRAKNAGNIIMKNLMDFCIGTVVFCLLGFGLLCGEDAFFGLVGIPNMAMFSDFGGWVRDNGSNFVFNLVFCATAATIVSGAMAERTKFSAYCLYSAVISLVIYPIEAHWIWGGGWLAQAGYVDFAGSTAIHMVGGIASLVGAAILGPRVGKYFIDKKTGKKKPRAIPGHSITLGALGCFILWFGWYGFNGAAATDVAQLGSIFLVTTISPAVATVVTMLVTWVRNKKPDVSMCLNGALAGLVGITAGCSSLDAAGAVIVGIVSGVLVIVGVEFIDKVLKVDDPVGAIAVHGFNGVWGGIAVGLLANPNSPNAPTGVLGTAARGLFYGGGFDQLGIQLLGILAVGAYTAVMMFIVFKILKIKAVNGLRASREDEVTGLDISEHGLLSGYAGFMFSPESAELLAATGEEIAAIAPDTAPVSVAIPVHHREATAVSSDVKFTKVEIITRPEKLDELKEAMNTIGISGMTVTNVIGFGQQRGAIGVYRGVEVEATFRAKVKMEIVVCKVPVETVIAIAKRVLYTGNIGDGKIFVYDIENVVKVRTSEEGYDALQDT